MSMNGYLRRISILDAQKIEKKPASVKQLLRGPYDMEAMIRDQLRGKASPKREAMEAAYARSKQISEELKRSGRTPGPATPEEYQRMMQPLRDAGAFGEEPDVLRLEKSWHTLHYLLTGSAEPVESTLGKTILGGKEVGADLGYGPARVLTAIEVQEVAGALSKQSKDELTQRVDVRSMMASNLYACHDDGDLELAQQYFEQTREFYIEAAALGCAMLLYIK
jgi:hypothetical protein